MGSRNFFTPTKFRNFSHLTPVASAEQVQLNEPHSPGENAIGAFNIVLRRIKSEVIKSRHDWDKHEPEMWSRAAKLSNDELTNFTIENDLVLVRLNHPFTWIQLIYLHLGLGVVSHYVNDTMTPLHRYRSGVEQRPTGT